MFLFFLLAHILVLKPGTLKYINSFTKLEILIKMIFSSIMQSMSSLFHSFLNEASYEYKLYSEHRLTNQYKELKGLLFRRAAISLV